jgi:hypothetical protein
MSYYMGIHTLPGFSKEMLLNATPEIERIAMRGNPSTRFLRALSSFSEGRVVCEFEAPSKDGVAAVYARLGFPYDAIVEVDAVCDTGTGSIITSDV